MFSSKIKVKQRRFAMSSFLQGIGAICLMQGAATLQNLAVYTVMNYHTVQRRF